MAKQGASVVVSDLSKGLLNIALKLASKHDVVIEALQFSADCIPFEDESFDIFYATDVLHHVKIEKTLKECRRVFKPGGIFANFDPPGPQSAD